jgi:hypothetical protein
MDIKHKNIILPAVCLLLLVSGYQMGSCGGRGALNQLYFKGGTLVSLMYMPSGRYYESAGLLSSSNELERISGYYSILEGVGFDEEYLKERYLAEDSSSAKRVILWVLTQGGRRSLNVLASLYESAGADEKADIEQALRKVKDGF